MAIAFRSVSCPVCTRPVTEDELLKHLMQAHKKSGTKAISLAFKAQPIKGN